MEFQDALEKVTCRICGRQVPITAARAVAGVESPANPEFESPADSPVEYECLECRPVEDEVEPDRVPEGAGGE